MRDPMLLHNNEPAEGGISKEQVMTFQAAFDRYAKALEQPSVLISAEILQPSTATTTFTLRNGQREIRQGPLHNTPEKLAGCFVIDIPDLDTALNWAERCPGAQYSILEIRPSAIVFSKGEGSRRCKGLEPEPIALGNITAKEYRVMESPGDSGHMEFYWFKNGL